MAALPRPDNPNEIKMYAPVRSALDELAATVADTPESPATRHILVQVVRDLEDAAAAPLGSTCSDPNVVMMRRFARAHRLLLVGDHTLDVTRILGHVAALRGLSSPAPQATTSRTNSMIGV